MMPEIGGTVIYAVHTHPRDDVAWATTKTISARVSSEFRRAKDRYGLSTIDGTLSMTIDRMWGELNRRVQSF